METRANYIAVGLFTLAALAGALLMVWWMGIYGGNDDQVPLDVRVKGSVTGLGVGSVVRFNGIVVGKVSGLELDADPSFVVVKTRVQPNLPLRANTRASIGSQGLSGGAFIALEGGTTESPRLFTPTGQNAVEAGKPVQLNGDPSALNDLLARANRIATRVDDVALSVQQLVQANERTINVTLSNIETFSAALSDNSENIARFLKSAGDVAETLEALSGQLDGTLKQTEAIVKAIEPNTVRQTVENVRDFTSALAEEREQIRQTVRAANETVAELRTFSTGLNTSLKSVDELVGQARSVVGAVEPEAITKTLKSIEEATARANGLLAVVDQARVRQTVDDTAATVARTRQIIEGVDPATVQRLLTDVADASRSINALVVAIDTKAVNGAVENFAGAAGNARKILGDIDKVTAPLGDRAADINAIITDAQQLTARLNEASTRVAGVLEQIDGFFGSGDANGLVAEARRTLVTFRQTAARFDAQFADISRSITGFTKRGLGDTQGLINDARRSLGNLDRVITNLSNNPSSLLTGQGGSAIRESSGGQRPRR